MIFFSMARVVSLMLLLFTSTMAANDKYYNVLSLESAQYKGLLTAEFISSMETRAYHMAVEGKCEIGPRKQ